MTIKYHGEVFDEGRKFLTVEAETGYGTIVTVNLQSDELTVEFNIGENQARELARHLQEAANTLTGQKA